MRGYGLSIHMGSLSGELVFTVQLNTDLTINHFISLFLLTMLMQPPACSASSSLHSSHLSPTHYRIAFQHILPWYREKHQQFYNAILFYTQFKANFLQFYTFCYHMLSGGPQSPNLSVNACVCACVFITYGHFLLFCAPVQFQEG